MDDSDCASGNVCANGGNCYPGVVSNSKRNEENTANISMEQDDVVVENEGEYRGAASLNSGS